MSRVFFPKYKTMTINNIVQKKYLHESSHQRYYLTKTIEISTCRSPVVTKNLWSRQHRLQATTEVLKSPVNESEISK